MVLTQEGSTKGPLDVLANDGVQLSTLAGTVLDVATPVEMTAPFLDYTVLDATSIVPPPDASHDRLVHLVRR